MAHIPLAACLHRMRTGGSRGSRRRQGAVVPIGTKTVVDLERPKDNLRRTGLQACPIRVVKAQPLNYLICKVFADCGCLNQSLDHFLSPAGTAAPCRRREPTVTIDASAGGE